MAKQRFTEKQINRELTRISRNVPTELLTTLLKKEKVAPTIQQVIEKAMTDPSIELTPEQRGRYQNMIDSGLLDREVEVINPDAEKAISDWYDAEIALAVKLGRLPKEAPMPAFIKKKGLKHAKRQTESLKQLFSAEQDSEEGARSDDREDTGTSGSQPADDPLLSSDAGRSDEQGTGG